MRKSNYTNCTWSSKISWIQKVKLSKSVLDIILFQIKTAARSILLSQSAKITAHLSKIYMARSILTSKLRSIPLLLHKLSSALSTRPTLTDWYCCYLLLQSASINGWKKRLYLKKYSIRLRLKTVRWSELSLNKLPAWRWSTQTPAPKFYRLTWRCLTCECTRASLERHSATQMQIRSSSCLGFLRGQSCCST